MVMERQHRIGSYKRGCRCDKCLEAKRQANQEESRVKNVNGPLASKLHDDNMDLLLEFLHCR